MATKYAANYEAAYVTKPPSKYPNGDVGGRVRSLYAEYDLGDDAAVLSSGDKVYMFKIPKGARVIGGFLSSDDLGNTITVEVGWEASADGVESADTDGFFNGLDLNSAADTFGMYLEAPSANLGLGKRFNAEVDVIITAEATGTATDGTIKLNILYVVD